VVVEAAEEGVVNDTVCGVIDAVPLGDTETTQSKRASGKLSCNTI
jgi:hypothetical protein